MCFQAVSGGWGVLRTSAASDVVPEAGASTSSKVITFDDRQSISFCSNAVQTSYVMLHDFDNRRTIDIVLSPALECMAWHTDSNRAGRSAHDALEWNIQQCVSGIMKHVCTLFGGCFEFENGG